MASHNDSTIIVVYDISAWVHTKTSLLTQITTM